MRMLPLFLLTLATTLFADDLPLEQWARSSHFPIRSVDLVPSASDLSALETFVAESQVFGFGESHHGLHEPNQARLRFFEHLVRTKGFRAMVLESGILEGYLVERYIQGEILPLNEVLEKGFTHGMGKFTESRDLVEWMKDYNAAHPQAEDKVHFYGMDLSIRGDSPVLPLETLRPYLVKADAEYTHAVLDPLLSLAGKANAVLEHVEAAYKKLGSKYIEPDYLDCFTTISFEAMSQEDQSALERGVVDLIEHITRNRSGFIAKSSESEFEWNRQVAVQASQMIRNLRSRQSHPKITYFDKSVGLLKQLYPNPVETLHINLEHIPATSGEQGVEDLKSYFKGRETRELSEAENVRWVQKRHGKAMVYAQNGHLMKSQVDITVGDLHVGKNGGLSAGDFVHQMFGKDYVFLASTLNEVIDSKTGAVLEEYYGIPLASTSGCIDCVERPLAVIGTQTPLFFLDLRKASGAALKELERDRENRFDFIGFQRFNTREAYDGILFINRASLANSIR